MPLLLVEDDTIVRLTVGEFLRDAGFDVLEAGEVTEAIRATEDVAWRISVLVTDLDLGPGPDGLDLAAALRARLPALPIICATGSPERLEGRPLAVRPERVFVKPFDLEALAEAVRILEARRVGRPEAVRAGVRRRAAGGVIGPQIA